MERKAASKLLKSLSVAPPRRLLNDSAIKIRLHYFVFYLEDVVGSAKDGCLDNHNTIHELLFIFSWEKGKLKEKLF